MATLRSVRRVQRLGWYDFFSRFYDASLERQYAEQRVAATEALRLSPGMTVLDVPCGTGQSFDGLAAAIGDSGMVLGVDASSGMLARAQRRADDRGLACVRLVHADVHTLDATAVNEAGGGPTTIDRLHVFLGLTAFPNWEDAFAGLWALLRPGGRCVVVDVHAARPGLQGRMVNWVARADIRRQWWTALEAVGEQYERTALPSTWQHGGEIFCAAANKPERPALQ